jgi:cell division protein FtsB
MNWIFGDWVRVLVVTGLVGATTGYVWVKVQISETATGVVRARRASETLREERSKLQAAVDLVQRPGIVRERAARELNMVEPTASTTSELIVGVVRHD